MPKLIMPVGIPGCGKSTFGERLLRHNNMQLISTDDIRAQMVRDGMLSAINDMSCNKEVFARFHRDIEDYLMNFSDVYVDATNLQPFAREKIHKIAERVGVEVFVILFTNCSVAVSRNLKRAEDRIVPAKAMVGMLEQYEKALHDIPQEHAKGWYSSVVTVEGIS